MGLACGGTIKVFVEPVVRPEILEAARGPGGEVVATIIEGPGTGGALRISRGRHGGGRRRPAPRHPARCRAGRAPAGGERDRHRGPSRRVGIGVPGGVPPTAPAGHLRRHRTSPWRSCRSPAARLSHHRGRWPSQAFISRERFPEADELIQAWPEEAFERIGLDATSYVCVLSHDPKFDEPALQPRSSISGGLRRRYRVEEDPGRAPRAPRAEADSPTDEIARIHGPIGLDLGGRAAARDGAGDSGGDDASEVRVEGEGRRRPPSPIRHTTGTPGRSGTSPLVSVAGLAGTGPTQRTQVLPGWPAKLARPDQDHLSALRMLIVTPLCQTYCSANGSRSG